MCGNPSRLALDDNKIAFFGSHFLLANPSLISGCNRVKCTVNDNCNPLTLVKFYVYKIIVCKAPSNQRRDYIHQTSLNGINEETGGLLPAGC